MITTPHRKPRNRQLAQSYATVGLETSVMSASPAKLISMLFAGARNQVTKAKFHLKAGQVRERGESISKALDIITLGLRASVDESQSEVAKSLVQCYELMVHHLVLANAQSSIEHLDTVLVMINDLSGAWDIATDQPLP